MDNIQETREEATLELEQLDEVSGGESVLKVAEMAVIVCGEGNVKSVNENGFVCK